MNGREILIEPLATGGHAAALVVDGRLQDLLVDPPAEDRTPRPEAIFRAVPARTMKGAGGAFVDLGAGLTGFLRGPNPPPPGPFLAQVTGWAEPGKAAPVTERLLLKGHAAILTPESPGLNIARSLTDVALRAHLGAIAATAMAGAAADLGLILRSAAQDLPEAEIVAEISALRARLQRASTGTTVGPVLPAPGAAAEAKRDWATHGTIVIEGAAALAERGLWDDIATVRRPQVKLGEAWMAVEPTLALVAVDVNTGADASPAAALKANLAAAKELPRQLRLRGLGGQIVVDFAPLARKDRARVEAALGAALRVDTVETAVLGWTPLGHLELRRKRARRALAETLGAG